MNRVEIQLTSTSSMLTQAGKLQLVNSVMSSLPPFTMCSVQVSVVVHEYFNRARRYCMRSNSEINAKSKPLVAWKNAQDLRGKEDLVSSTSETQNTALLLKHLDKFYNKKDIP
jgi:hypothetical protein